MNALLGTVACCLLASVLSLSGASAEVLVVGIDRKFAYEDGQRQALAPGHDEVAFYDLKDPAHPALMGRLPLENSIIGPPTNIAVTPDQKLALIASAVKSVQADDGKSWKSVPSDELHVVDLSARPPKLIKTLKVGSQPSGLSIDRSGRMALVANRDGKSISVLKIAELDVNVTGTVPLGDVVTSVAISSDGRRALATKFAAHKVAFLSIGIDGSVEYDKIDVPVGLFPWTVTVAPNGERAFVTNIGANAASDGNAKTVSVIDLKSTPPRVSQHVNVGDAPEGIAVSPNGRIAAATILRGSYDAPKGAWWRNANGHLTLLRIEAGVIRVSENTEVGAFPEGVAFSANGRFVYIGNFASSSLSIIELNAAGRIIGQRVQKLAGPPASLRIGSQ